MSPKQNICHKRKILIWDVKVTLLSMSSEVTCWDENRLFNTPPFWLLTHTSSNLRDNFAHRYFLSKNYNTLYNQHDGTVQTACQRQLLCFSRFRQTQIKRLKVKVGREIICKTKLLRIPPNKREQNLGTLIKQKVLWNMGFTSKILII